MSFCLGIIFKIFITSRRNVALYQARMLSRFVDFKYFQRSTYVCLVVDVYTWYTDQHKRLIHKLQANEKNYDLLPMKCLENIP